MYKTNNEREQDVNKINCYFSLLLVITKVNGLFYATCKVRYEMAKKNGNFCNSLLISRILNCKIGSLI